MKCRIILLTIISSGLFFTFTEKNLFARNLGEIIKLAENNLQLKAAGAKTKSLLKAYQAAKGANYPRLDLGYNATYLQDKPVMYPDMPMGPKEWQIGPQNNYEGFLTLSYPLFKGFAVTASIDKAKLESLKAGLEEQDVKRQINMSIVSLYTQTVAAKQAITAKTRALDAAKESMKKAEGFYDKGLIPVSEVYNIKAGAHEIEANLIHTKNKKKMLLNQLSYFVDTQINDVEGLPDYQDLDLSGLIKEALQEREDIKALQLALEIKEHEITIAKSGNYPEISLFAQAKRTGDGMDIDGDDFTNKNKSAAGVIFSYNLFDGYAVRNKIAAAKQNAVMVKHLYNDYKQQIRTEITNSYLAFKSLQEELCAADKRFKAQKAFYRLTKGRFDNQLVSMDELSRAIADLATARAKYFALKAGLYEYYSRLLLEVSLKKFTDAHRLW